VHYVLFYEKAPDHAQRERPLQQAHLEHLRQAVRRGEIVLAGSLADPADGAALLVFDATSAEVPKAFAAADPYVTSGVVQRFWVRTWETVAGAGAAAPLPGLGGDGR
jgi:uncharacterized protein YciI